MMLSSLLSSTVASSMLSTGAGSTLSSPGADTTTTPHDVSSIAIKVSTASISFTYYARLNS